MSEVIEFEWVRAQFADVRIAVNTGKYLERAEILWDRSCFSPAKAQALLFQLTQADGWQIEHVRWQWVEGHMGMRACTLVRPTARTECDD